MKTSKFASFFAFVLLVSLSLGFASAQLSFNPNSFSLSIPAGQSATINFNLNNTGSTNYVGLNWGYTPSLGTVTFNGNQGQISSNSNMAVSAIITIPSTASGTITGLINVTGSNGSASISTTLPITITVTQSSSNLTISGLPSAAVSVNQNVTFTVTNNGNNPLSIDMSEISTPNLFGVTFAPSSFSLNANQGTQVNALLNSLTGLKFGLNNIVIKADASTQSRTASFQVKKTFCANGETLNSNLTIDNIEWANNGEGEDNNWELLDEIEVEADITNNNNDNDVDVVAELALYDSSGKNIADDLVFLEDSDSDNEEIEINIDEDDDATVTWKFKVPADFEVGNYKLSIKVYDDDAGESRSCRDSSSDLDNIFFQSIDIEETSDEGRFVVVDEIQMDSPVSCGQTVAGQFTVYNVGDEDQDRVKILIRNKELGIDIFREITSDLDKGDDETMDFIVTIPATAANGNYILEFVTQYDYKNGVYREDSQDSFDAPFEVIGCSQNLGNTGGNTGLTNIKIDAKLDSEAKAGKELLVVATIKNTGTIDATYSLSARGYSSWAELKDISDATIQVDAGDSVEVVFTLLVNNDATGIQSFDIQVAQGGKVQVQEVEVELASSKLNFFSSDNSLVWIIGLVNLVLIILIIVVAVRMSRR